MDSNQPNAFATGRDPEHSVICVTTALLDKLDYYELEGVVAVSYTHLFSVASCICLNLSTSFIIL